MSSSCFLTNSVLGATNLWSDGWAGVPLLRSRALKCLAPCCVTATATTVVLASMLPGLGGMRADAHGPQGHAASLADNERALVA